MPRASPARSAASRVAEKFRPFCSRRCADVDLNRWLCGVYAVPGKEEEDEDGDRAGRIRRARVLRRRSQAEHRPFWTAGNRAFITPALVLRPPSGGPGAQVAQLVEHCTENAGVGGSIPPLGTITFRPSICPWFGPRDRTAILMCKSLLLFCSLATGPKLKRILLASLFFALTTAIGNAELNNFVTIAPEPKSYAWWLRAEFHPFDVEVRGIPLKMRATWCKATEFRKELFPPDRASDLDHSGGLSFTVDGSFDGSKTRQTALVGAYETCTGKKGSFLLILARPQARAPVIRFVHEMVRPFGMLTASTDSTLAVLHAMGCDHFTKFKWDKSRRRFVQLPFREDEPF